MQRAEREGHTRPQSLKRRRRRGEKEKRRAKRMAEVGRSECPLLTIWFASVGKLVLDEWSQRGSGGGDGGSGRSPLAVFAVSRALMNRSPE